MAQIKYICTDRRKTWQITCKGKIISKHLDFWHAQDAILRLYKQGRIDNSYKIEPIN